MGRFRKRMRYPQEVVVVDDHPTIGCMTYFWLLVLGSFLANTLFSCGGGS